MQCSSPTLTFWAYESDDVEQLPLCHSIQNYIRNCEDVYPLLKHNKCANTPMNDMMPMGSNPLHICSKTGLQAYLELRRTVNPTKLTGYKYSSLAKCIQFASLGRIRKNLTFSTAPKFTKPSDSEPEKGDFHCCGITRQPQAQ